MTIREAADRLACSPANVYALVERGRLPVVRIGAAKGYRIDPDDLQDFVDAQKFRLRGADRPSPPRPTVPLRHLRRPGGRGV